MRPLIGVLLRVLFISRQPPLHGVLSMSFFVCVTCLWVSRPSRTPGETKSGVHRCVRESSATRVLAANGFIAGRARRKGERLGEKGKPGSAGRRQIPAHGRSTFWWLDGRRSGIALGWRATGAIGQANRIKGGRASECGGHCEREPRSRTGLHRARNRGGLL